VNLTADELAILVRAKESDGLAPDDLADEQLATVRRLAYLGMLDRQCQNGAVRRYVLTPAGAQAIR
jgi:hypothetical protein